jgi:hypothetical protein
MSKHVEVEDGELLIRSSNGTMAIVPKAMAKWVDEHISSGNHHVVDHYVKGLAPLKNKAEDGAYIPPSKYGKTLPEVVVKSESTKVPNFVSNPSDALRVDVLNGMTPSEYMETPYVYKREAPSSAYVTNILKKYNTALGGNIEVGGHKNEGYSDLVRRLSKTPGTIQYILDKAYVPPVPSPFAGPLNLVTSAIPYINRTAGALGDAILDPINLIPVGEGIKAVTESAKNIPAAVRFFNNASQSYPEILNALKIGVKNIPNAMAGKDVLEATESYISYPEKNNNLTPEQQKVMDDMINNLNKKK